MAGARLQARPLPTPHAPDAAREQPARQRVGHGQKALLPILLLLAAGCLPAPPAATAYLRRTAPPLGPTSTPPAIAPTATHSPPTPTLRPLPPIGPQDWSRGPQGAPVTLLVYTDFQ